MIDERLPRYQRLRDEIAEKIARHVWRPGDALPTEADLAASHNIAVGTVRKAIDALAADELVERQQGRGTFVRRPQFDASLFRFFRYAGMDEQTVPGSRLLGREAISATPASVAEVSAITTHCSDDPDLTSAAGRGQAVPPRGNLVAA